MTRTYKILIGLLVLSVGLVYYLYQGDSGNHERQPLLPELNADNMVIADIDRLLITNQTESLDIQKTAQGWLLNDDFYARMETLFEWVQALKNAQLVEIKTADPNNFPQLHLSDDDLRVRLYQGDKLLADIILGKAATVMNSRFVRHFNQTQSWMVSNLNDLGTEKNDWQLRILFDYVASQVFALLVVNTDGSTIRLLKNTETGQWQVDGEVKTDIIIDNDKVEKLASSLAMFSIEQAEPLTVNDSSLISRLEYGLVGGANVKLAIHQALDKKVLTVYDSQQPDRYKSWQFILPEYKLKALSVTKQQLLKPAIESALPEELPPAVTSVSLEDKG